MEPSDNTDNMELLSCEDFHQILNLLLCHAFLKNHQQLISAISSYAPNFKDLMSTPYKPVLIFLSFYKKWRETGPLPGIRQYRFLLTLHEAIMGLLAARPRLLDKMTKSDMIKMIMGIRCLLGKSILLEEKFVVKDIETFISKYYPLLPVTTSNKTVWINLTQVLGINLDTDKQELKVISDFNKLSIDHLSKRIDNLPRERGKSQSEIDSAFLAILESIDSKLSAFVNHVEKEIPNDFLETVIENPSPHVQKFQKNISTNFEELQLLQVFDEMKNMDTESKFWSSDVIQLKIEM